MSWQSRLMAWIGLLIVVGTAHGQYMLPDTIRAQQLLVRSLTYLEVGQPDEAIPLLEEALSLVPEEPALLSALAQAHRQQHDLNAARFYAEKACRQAPQEVSYCHEWLDVLEASGESSALQEAVRFIRQHHPDDPVVLRWQARWAHQHGDLVTARQLYEQLRDRYGADTSLHRTLWPLQLATGDTLAALQTLEALLPFDADNPELWRTAGFLYFRQGSLEKARWALERALRLAPEDTAAARLLARLKPHPTTPAALLARARHLIEQRPEDPQARQEARALLQDLLRRDSTHVEALRLLARLYRDERPDWSAELLTRSLQYDPRDLSVWIDAAHTWLAAGMPRRSAQVAEEALFLFPDQPPLLRLAAYAYLSLGRPDAALPYVETLLTLLPEWPEHTPEEAAELHALQGHLLARLERSEAAREACRQARRLDDRSAAVRLHCAVVDWLAGGPQEATLQEAQATLPDPPEPWMPETLGWLYLQAGRPELARAVLQQALQTGHAGPLTYAYLGEALARLGHLDEARRIWQEALRKDPDNAYLHHLLTTH
ncbi:tetratricopeptide repeat protein [Rhodothermus marinus]|uniref:tetratricopeptide repeat protein n=1 Tax=Rhodothermus marinus TaxID=29549 RepID=UPI001F54D1CE|nr:tetratricopeptide repeat protein [Rhodothermus marinus]